MNSNAANLDGTGHTSSTLTGENVAEDQRQRTLSYKALHNAVQVKESELRVKNKEVRDAADAVFALLNKKATPTEVDDILPRLNEALKNYEAPAMELDEIFKQDKWRDFLEQS